MPYTRYVFLVDFADRGVRRAGAPEQHPLHRQLFHDGAPWEYRRLLTLFSHEFFHAWNVKRMRPIALGPFDYSAENYTKSLWIAEGRDELLRERDPEEGRDHLRPGVPRLPLRRHQRGEVASVEQAVQPPRSPASTPGSASTSQDENTPNVSPSYYRQGAVLGLSWTSRSGGAPAARPALDDAMRKVYCETYKAGQGLHGRGVRGACCGGLEWDSTDEVFTRYVHGGGGDRLRQVSRLRRA